MELVLGKLREKLLGRGHTVSVAEQLQQLLPVDIAVQPNPDPATRPHVRRREKAIRGGFDHQTLIYGLRFTPHRISPRAVVSVGVSVHREDLILHAEGRLAPCLYLVRLWEGECQLSDARERVARLRLNQWTVVVS